ncbi:MAG: hypothetical protein KGJ93_02570 [Patescibacteria group bacterium]|nr:hypothetical protein [Patescibacteria group bacterium]
MTQFSKKLLLFGLVAGLLVAAHGVSAAGACNGFADQFVIKLTGGGSINTIEGLPTICNPQTAVYTVILLLLEFSAGVAVIFLMLGGYWYLTSAGNEEQAEKGRKALTSAIIGLVIIFLAFAIVRIVVNLISGGPTTSGSLNSTSQTQQQTSSGGNTGVTQTGGGTQSPPFASSGMLANITQADFQSYSQQDYLAASGAVQFTPLQQNTGVSVAINISSGNKSLLEEIASFCGANQDPEAELFYNNNFVDSSKFVSDGSGSTWTATPAYHQIVQGGDKFQIYVCNNPTPVTYTVPAGIR